MIEVTDPTLLQQLDNLQPVTDPAILQQLEGGSQPVEDPAILAQLNGSAKEEPGIVDQGLDVLKGVANVPNVMLSRGMSGLAGLVAPALPQEAGDWLRKQAEEQKQFNLQGGFAGFGGPETTAGQTAQDIVVGLGTIGTLVANPALGMTTLGAQAQEGAQEVVKGLSEKGVTPGLTHGAATAQAAGNVALGLIPGAGPIRGALMNWATGQLSDMAAYEILAQNGYKEAADTVIGKRGIADRQGLVDLVVGAVGGKVEARGIEKAKADETIASRLDALDKTRAEQITQEKEQPAQLEGKQGELFTPEGEVVERQLDLPFGEATPVKDISSITVYHGTDKNFDDFQGGMFTSNRDRASNYAMGSGGRVLEARLDIKNPMPWEKAFGLTPEQIKEAGYDGTVQWGDDGSVMRAVVVDPTQIKKAPKGEPVPANASPRTPEENLAVMQRNAAREKERQGWLDLGDAAFKRARDTEDPFEKKQALLEFDEYANRAEEVKNQMEKETPLASDTGRITHPDESGLTNRLADVQKLRSYDANTGEFNPVEYLRTMRDSHVEGKNRAYKAIYDFILGALEKMPQGRIPRFALDIDPLTQKPRDQTYDRTGNKGKDSAGQYDPNTDTVWIGRRGESEGTLVHETMHALTSRILYMYKPTDVRVRGLYAIYKSVIKHPAFKGEYGTLDIHEFIAEVFSSPTFQAKLAQHQVSGTYIAKAKNALSAIAKEIVNALGYRDTTPEGRAFTNALEEVVFHVENLVDIYATNKAHFDERWDTEHPDSKNVPGIPSSQRGQPAVDKVTEGAASIAKAAQSPPRITDEHTAKQEVISKTAGMDYIPADPRVTPELIAQIAGEKDGSSTWALTPGALARSELANSTLVKAVYRFANNAVKRAEHFGRNTIQPVEKTISKLLRNDKDAALLKDILMRELARKQDYTPDELRAAGVPDKLIMAQAEFRAMMQEALEKQNAALRAKGLKEIKGIDAYYSARWSGPWRANVKDADGKIIWQIAEQSKSLADNAIKYLQARQPDLKYEPVTYRKGRERGDTIEAGYLDMLNLLDKDDPRIQTLKEIYQEYLEGKTDNISNQEKHQLRKTGVRGFAGDRPWSKTDVKDFFVQQFEYAKNAARWAEFQQASEGINKLLSDPSIQDSQPNNIKFSKDWFKNQLGFGTSELFSQIDNSLAKSLGISPQKLQEYMGGAKTFFYLKVLGLSLPFTVAQFLQPAITTPAWHADLSNKGFKHNPILTMIQGIQGGSTAATWHYANGFNNKPVVAMADKLMTPLQREAAQYMEANQVVDINPISDIKRNLRPRAVKIAAVPYEFTIRHSELIARSMAFMSFVSHLEQSGEYNTKTKEERLKLFQKAEEMTSLSMTDYRSTERAQVFEKGGLIGDAAATLHAYQINNLMQLTKFSKEAAKGNVMPLFTMVALQAAAGGVLGLWFIEDLDDLLDNLKKIMPHDQYMKVKDFNLKNWILDNFGQLASFGLASKVSGTNIHTRMNASDQIPIWPFESGAPLDQAMGLVPFSKEIWESGKAGISALSPDATPQERAQAMYQLAPSGFKGALETQPPFTQNGISASPRDLSQGQYRRTEEETNLRKVGLRSPKEAEFMEKKYALSKVERELQSRVQSAGKRATEFFTSGESKDGVEELIKYTQLGGDPMTIINGIPQAKINQVTTEIERRALTAASGSRPAVLKLQRALQFYGNPTNR